MKNLVSQMSDPSGAVAAAQRARFHNAESERNWFAWFTAPQYERSFVRHLGVRQLKPLAD